MPSTSNKLYSVQTATSNAGTWGAGASHALNEGVIEIIDLNLGGILTLTPGSGGAISLSSTQARYAMVRLSGVLTGNPAYTSANVGFYMVENVTSGSFTTTWTNGVGSAVTIEQSHRYLLFADATNGVRIISNVDLTGLSAQFPAGTVTTFIQAAAPTGWTISSSFNDRAIRLNSTSGGGTAGSVAFSTLFARTATDSYTLQTADIPAHTHSVAGTTGSQNANHQHTYSGTTANENASHQHTYDQPSGTVVAGTGGLSAVATSVSTTTGSQNTNHQHTYSGTTADENAAHQHTFSVTSGSAGSTGGHAHGLDMRLTYVTAIPCTKD